MKLPKVLVFTAIYEDKDYCLDKFLDSAKKINYPNFDHIFVDNSVTSSYTKKLKEKGLDAYWVGRGNNSREAIARSQNFARQKAIEGEYDYMLSLESDIMCPEDTIQRLIIRGKDVITARYDIGDDKIRIPCITVPKWNKELGAYGTRLLSLEELPEYKNKGVKQVQAGGMGCCLIHKSIFTKFRFTYDPRLRGHSDIYFFNDLFRAKIPVFVDTDLECEHDNSPWKEVKDR